MFAIIRPRPLARMWEKEMRRGEPQQGLENTKVVRTLRRKPGARAWGHRMRTTRRPRARKMEEKVIPLLKRLYILCTRMHPHPLIPMQRRPTWILSRRRDVRTRIPSCLRKTRIRPGPPRRQARLPARTRGRGGAEPRRRRRAEPVRGMRVVPRRAQSNHFHRMTDAVTFAVMRTAGKH